MQQASLLREDTLKRALTLQCGARECPFFFGPAWLTNLALVADRPEDDAHRQQMPMFIPGLGGSGPASSNRSSEAGA